MAADSRLEHHADAAEEHDRAGQGGCLVDGESEQYGEQGDVEGASALAAWEGRRRGRGEGVAELRTWFGRRVETPMALHQGQ